MTIRGGNLTFGGASDNNQSGSFDHRQGFMTVGGGLITIGEGRMVIIGVL